MHETFDLLGNDFEKQQDSIKIILEGGGSRTGLLGIKDKEIDLGLSSFAFDLDSVLGEGHQVEEQVVAYDGIVLINHDSNPITKLTNEQVSGIYSGSLNDWSQLGGPSGLILPIVRNENSGTQRFFTQYFNIDRLSPQAVVAQENTEIVQRVLSNQNGIGFIGLSYFAVGVNNILIPSSSSDSSFVGPSKTSLTGGYYPLKRPLRVYYQRDRSPSVDAFLNYLNSSRAQYLIEQEGLIPNPRLSATSR